MSHETWRLTLPRGRILELSQVAPPRVMGILNITPDSFSDGGLWVEPEKAARHGLQMVAQGAEILDLGAESTRPGGGVYGAGAAEINPEREAERLLPVLERLRPRTDAVISVDTRKAEVARLALEVGADLINDVGGLSDPELGRVVATAGCPLVLMHSRGAIDTMQRGIRFDDVVREVSGELGELVAKAQASGVDPGQVILDPGIGFGKTAEQNLRLLAGLGHFREHGRPILVGASRKSFIAKVDGSNPDQRLGGSLAAAAAATQGNASIVRVHDVAETHQFLRVRNAIDLATSDAD